MNLLYLLSNRNMMNNVVWISLQWKLMFRGRGVQLRTNRIMFDRLINYIVWYLRYLYFVHACTLSRYIAVILVTEYFIKLHVFFKQRWLSSTMNVCKLCSLLYMKTMKVPSCLILMWKSLLYFLFLEKPRWVLFSDTKQTIIDLTGLISHILNFVFPTFPLLYRGTSTETL